MNFIMLVSMLLLIFGLLGLYPVASRQAGLGGKLLRFGIIASVIEWSTIIIVIGMRFFEIHLMQRSNMPHDGGGLLPADFAAAALAVHIILTAVLLASILLYPLASIMVGLGIASRFASTNLYKVAGYVMAAGGLLGLANLLVAMNFPDAGIQNMFLINSIALYTAGVSPLHLRIRHVPRPDRARRRVITPSQHRPDRDHDTHRRHTRAPSPSYPRRR